MIMTAGIFFVSLFTLVSSTPFGFVPTQSADIHFIIDGQMPHETIKTITYSVGRQLKNLTEVFENAGFNLGVAPAFTDTADETVGCVHNHIMTDGNVFVGPLDSLAREYGKGTTTYTGPHLTQDAILYLAKVFEKPERRRVIALFTNTQGPDFGNFTGRIDACHPYETTEAEYFKSTLEKYQIGLVYALVDGTPEEVDAVQKKYGDLLFDVLVDNSPLDAIDTIEQHVARMLAPEWIATTSTTSKTVRECVRQCYGCEAL